MHSLKADKRLLSLRGFLLKERLYKEAYALGKIVLASDEEYKNSYQDLATAETQDARAAKKISSEDETVAMRPGARRSWRSPSEPHLYRADLELIRFIAGTESVRRCAVSYTHLTLPTKA